MRTFRGNKVPTCLVLSAERYQRSCIEAEVSLLPPDIAARVRVVPDTDGAAVFVLTPWEEKGGEARHMAASEMLVMTARELSVAWAEFTLGGCGSPGTVLSTSLGTDDGARADFDHQGMPVGPRIEACHQRDETLILVRGRFDMMRGTTTFSCDVSTPGRTAAAEIMRSEAQSCRNRFWKDPSGSGIRSMVLVGMTSLSVRVSDALWLGSTLAQIA